MEEVGTLPATDGPGTRCLDTRVLFLLHPLGGVVSPFSVPQFHLCPGCIAQKLFGDREGPDTGC